MIALCFTYVSSTISGIPTADIKISAFLQCSRRFLVLEWVIVTEQFEANKSEAIGLPTMFDLPIITAFFPLSSFNSFFNM